MEKRALPETRSFLKARKNKTYGYMGKKAHHKLETRGMSLSLSQNCLSFLSPTSTFPSHSFRFPFPFVVRFPSDSLIPDLPDGLLSPSSLTFF